MLLYGTVTDKRYGYEFFYQNVPNGEDESTILMEREKEIFPEYPSQLMLSRSTNLKDWIAKRGDSINLRFRFSIPANQRARREAENEITT